MQQRVVSLAFDLVSNILETGPVSSLDDSQPTILVFSRHRLGIIESENASYQEFD